MSEYLECQPKAVVVMPRPCEALDSCFSDSLAWNVLFLLFLQQILCFLSLDIFISFGL